MKKLIAPMALLTAFGLTLTSCTKKSDFTCNCTVTSGGQTQSAKGNSYKDSKRTDAEKDCQHVEELGQATASQAGGSFDCILTED